MYPRKINWPDISTLKEAQMQYALGLVEPSDFILDIRIWKGSEITSEYYKLVIFVDDIYYYDGITLLDSFVRKLVKERKGSSWSYFNKSSLEIEKLLIKQTYYLAPYRNRLNVLR